MLATSGITIMWQQSNSLVSRLPENVEKIGEPGDEARKCWLTQAVDLQSIE